jgi:hypothetical protein
VIAGDSVDIAYTLEQNEHPDFGGLELRLKDFKTETKAEAAITRNAAPLHFP